MGIVPRAAGREKEKHIHPRMQQHTFVSEDQKGGMKIKLPAGGIKMLPLFSPLVSISVSFPPAFMPSV